MPQSRPRSKERSFPSSLFQHGVRDCPSCGYSFQGLPPACSRCQCHLEGLDSILSNSNTPLQTIMDTAGIVKNNEQPIRKAIKYSEGKFPQIHLIFCTLPCPEGLKVSTLGWWMLNHNTSSKKSSWSGILLVDPSSHQVTFQAGYDLEIFVDRQKLDALLIECGRWFTLGEWPQGVTNFFKELHKMLKKSHREALIKTGKNALKRK